MINQAVDIILIFPHSCFHKIIKHCTTWWSCVVIEYKKLDKVEVIRELCCDFKSFPLKNACEKNAKSNAPTASKMSPQGLQTSRRRIDRLKPNNTYVNRLKCIRSLPMSSVVAPCHLHACGIKRHNCQNLTAWNWDWLGIRCRQFWSAPEC